MANFKLKESADKVSTGTSLAGVNIIPKTGFIMPYAGPTPLTTATGTSGSDTITVADATGAFIGQGIYGTGLNSPSAGLNYITNVSGTTITVAYPLTTTISGSNVRFCPVGWLLCDGNNGTIDLGGYFIIGANSSSNITSATGSNTHTHGYDFGNLTYTGESNSHEAAAYYTNLNSGGAVASHSHVINTSINTASHYSGNYINWSNGNNTTRTFRSHDHVGSVNHNSAAAAEPAHAHGVSAAGSISTTITETDHTHATASAPSGTSPASSTTPGNIIMNYIVKV